MEPLSGKDLLVFPDKSALEKLLFFGHKVFGCSCGVATLQTAGV